MPHLPVYPSYSRPLLVCLIALGLSACSALQSKPPQTGALPSNDLPLPTALKNKAIKLNSDDSEYKEALAACALEQAVQPRGKGGMSQALVVKLTDEISIWRLWSPGPNKAERMGHWWAYDQPRGTVDNYRKNYEICHNWNDLTRVTKCMLPKGSVIAIGPGQSVDAKTCNKNGEQYPANPSVWQTYVWLNPPLMRCLNDYQPDPSDIAHPLEARKGSKL